MAIKPYDPLPTGHPSDVVWICLINAKCTNVRDKASGKNFKFRVPFFLTRGVAKYAQPVPRHIAEELVTRSVRVPHDADDSGTVQTSALRTVPMFDQTDPPADWPSKLRRAGLSDGAAALYGGQLPGAAAPAFDPEIVKKQARAAVEDSLLERGRAMIPIIGAEAVGKLIDEGALPEALRAELPGKDAASVAATIFGQEDWRDVVTSIHGVDDPAVLDALAKLEGDRARPRASVVKAIEQARGAIAATAEGKVSSGGAPAEAVALDP